MKKKAVPLDFTLLVVFCVLLVVLIVLVSDVYALQSTEGASLSEPLKLSSAETVQETTPEPTPEPTPIPTALPDFEPVNRPSEVITGTSYKIGEQQLSSYTADTAHTIDMGGAADYAALPGITTFRGNNFRNTCQYGLAEVETASFGEVWSIQTSGQTGGGSYWGGSGWTGQPLLAEWPAAAKANMNMYDWAKEKDGLVEAIYATLGGYVYFFEAETGLATRDPLYLGYTFKGTGSLDPRGYPLLYVGGGVSDPNGKSARIMVVSLIDGEVLYTVGNDDDFAPRNWSAFDSSPLLDAETDQLIYPGENGILYIIDLNTQYDETAGTLRVSPEVVRFTYYSSSAEQYYYGMEDSAIIWRGHLFIADNGGDFLCIDLNDLEIEWRFDCLDDTNCTGVLEVDESGHPYIYLSTSFHLGWRSSYKATVPVWKIDAVTGDPVWRHNYECWSESGLSGGVQGALSLGEGSLDGYLYVAMARTEGAGNGTLLAIDTETGEECWRYTSGSYSWSTPVTFYDTDGFGYVLYTSCINGTMYLVDGLNGDIYDTYDFGCTVEATPVVCGNTVIIGTRGEQILGIHLN